MGKKCPPKRKEKTSRGGNRGGTSTSFLVLGNNLRNIPPLVYFPTPVFSISKLTLYIKIPSKPRG
jgi:hypothetical protein